MKVRILGARRSMNGRSAADGKLRASGGLVSPATEGFLQALRGSRMPPIAIFSGCTWRCCGGGQRPVALAREFVRKGFPTIYTSNIEPETRWSDGALIVAGSQMGQLSDFLRCIRPGFAIATYGLFLPYVRALKGGGWGTCYDLIDDWDGFADAKEIIPGSIEAEAELVSFCDVVTCSSPALIERAERLGAKRTALVRNGGLPEPIPQGPPPRDMKLGKNGTLVYVGYLYGSWFDWAALEGALKCLPDVMLNVIGEYTRAPEWENATFLGMRPFDEAIKYLPHADVGVIPFKGAKICRAVDPIKYYDYIAAGIPTAATDALSDLRGRPYTFLASGKYLAKAIRSALGAGRIPREAVKRLTAENSWGERAKQIVDIMHVTRHWRVGADLRNLKESDCKLRVTWQAPMSCNLRCVYCNTAGVREGKPALPPEFSADGIVNAFHGLAERYGPLYLSVCFGEPMSDADTIEIIGRVARNNKVDVSTNLTFSLSVLDLLPRNGNISFATSYHPHAWKSVKAFIAKRKAVEAAGFTCGVTSIVAYPRDLRAGKVHKWLVSLRRHIDSVAVLTYYGTWEGVQYPAGYTAEERAWLDAEVGAVYGNNTLATASPRGRRCAAGRRYIYVGWNGDVYRCVMLGKPMGNLFAADFEGVSAESAPCEFDVCPCPDLWQFIEESNG